MPEITLPAMQVLLAAKPAQAGIWGTAGDGMIVPLGPWDCVTVGKRQLPGIARVSGRGRSYGLEQKKSSGKDGATVTSHGKRLAEFTITLILGASPSDWADFKAVLPLLQPVSGGVLQAVSVSHPGLNSMGIDSMKVDEIDIPHPGSVVGTFEVNIKCLEHRPAQNMAGKGTAKKSVKDLERVQIAPEDQLAPLVPTNTYGGINTRSNTDYSAP